METIILRREPLILTHTYGKLTWNDSYLCDTLELPWLDNHEKTSCIPAGTYTAIAFQSPHNGSVWILENTTPRSMIEIHSANLTSELLGCIAVGVKGFLGQQPAVLHSRDTLLMLKKKLPPRFTLKIINTLI